MQEPRGTSARAPRLLRDSKPPQAEVSHDLGPSPEEKATVARARQGDREAFRVLVEDHQGRVFRLAMRVLRCNRQTAEDLCQEVFMRAHGGLPRFDGAVRFSTWLHTIAMNACISEYRRSKTLKRNKPTLSIDAPIGGDESWHIDPPSRELEPTRRAEQKEFAEGVRKAVDELPDEFRDAVLLRDMQDLSYEEIGEVLSLPPGTVRSRIHRGRLLLQEKLRDFI